MSVLNQMLRDLESRGIGNEVAVPQIERAETTVTPIVRPLAPPPTELSRSARIVRAAAWTGTAVIVAGTIGGHLWYAQQLNEYARAPQPLGAKQFAALAASGTPAATSAQTPPAVADATLAVDRAHATPTGAAAPASNAAEASEPSKAAVAIAKPPAAPVTNASGSKPTRASANADPARGVAAARSTKEPVQQSAAPAVSPAEAARRQPQEGPAIVSRPSNPGAALEARAAELVARGRSAEAMSVLAQLLQQAAANGNARATLAALQAEAGRRDLALQTLLAGSEFEPTRFAAAAARLQVELGDARTALATLDRVPEAARTAAHEALAGGISQRAGEHGRAVDAYTRALRAPGAPALWWTGLAISLEALNQATAAVDAYRRAIADPLLPASARSYAQARIEALAAATASGNRTIAASAAASGARP